MSLGSLFSKKRVFNFSAALLILFSQLLFSFVPIIGLQTAEAAFSCQVDTAGANDVPGQKDLTQMCVDYDGIPNSIDTTWNWDELGTSGANTLDACNLFDTDGDGKANYATCVTTQGDPASIQATTTYLCNDSRVDRCAGKSLIANGTTTCAVSVSSDDPFPAGTNSPNDIKGSCTIDLNSVGGSSAILIDVCSYPSQEPNSSPSDCVVFTTLPVATVKVVKSLTPINDSGLFNLYVDGPSDNDTTTVNDAGHNGTTGDVSFVIPGSGNPTGTVVVGETAGTNTSLSSYSSNIVCREEGGLGEIVAQKVATSLSFSVSDGDDILCTISNTASASITIVKDSIPNDGQDFTFTASGTGVAGFTLDDDSDDTLSNQKKFSNLAAGTYTFTESSTNGWYLDAINCPAIDETKNLQTGEVSLTITAGQNITCTFTNHKLGQIIVTKQTQPDGDQTQFSISATPSDGVVGNAAQTIADDETETYIVRHGTYAVNETVPAGWSQTSNNCSNLVIDGNTPLNNDGIPTRTCTINNTKLGSIEIIKDAVPNDGQDFQFAAPNFGQNGLSFYLDDDSDATLGNSNTFSQLLPGTYNVTEVATPGWKLTNLECDDVIIDSSTAQISLAAGENVICTFTNTKLVKIGGTKFEVNADGTIKTALPGWKIILDLDGSGDESAGDRDTVTQADGSYLFEDVLYGTNVLLFEIMQDGWTQIFAPESFTVNSVDDVTGLDFGNFHNATISGYKWNDLDGNRQDDNEPKLNGWTINLKNDNGVLIDSKVTSNGGAYSFTDLAPGDYSVCEDISSQVGWTQTFPAQNGCHSITIDVSGEVETANFGNQGRGSISVIKNVDSDGDGDIDFQDVDNWTWDIDSNGDFATGSGNSKSVAAGDYTVSEDQQDDYHVTASNCSGEDTPLRASESLSVSVSAGESVICTFTNTRDRGLLVVTKEVINDDGGTASASDFSLHVMQNNVDVTGSPAAGSSTGTDYELVTGTYTVSEDSPSPLGYSLVSITCDGELTDTIVVPYDDDVSCVVVNDDIAPTLKLVKEVINDNSGDSNASDWDLSASHDDHSIAMNSGDSAEDAVSGLVYQLNEKGSDGYHVETDWECDGGTFDSEQNTIKLSLDQDVVCTIVNDDDAHPGIELEKSSQSVAHEGDTVTYTFTVTNTGDEPLSNVEIDDPMLDNISYLSGDTNTNEILDVGEVWTFTADYLIQSQIANVVNEAEVCADSRDEAEVCNEDDHEIDVLHPSIMVEKFGPLYAYEGDLIGYTFTVTNTGDTTLYNVDIDDDIASSETCEKSTLVPDESMQCSAIYLVTIPTEENVINNVDACGVDELQLEVCNDDSHELDVIHPSLQIIKDGPSVAHEGDEVTYTFTVTNTGDIELSNVTVNDNIAGSATYLSGDTNTDDMLDIEETWTFTANYTIPSEQDEDVLNTAIACGYDPLNRPRISSDGIVERLVIDEPASQPVCDDDNHKLDVLHPEILVYKSGPSEAETGESIVYTFTVTNIGDTPLVVTSVEDNITGSGTYQSGDINLNELLDLDETWIYTSEYVVPEDQTGNIVNTVEVCGEDELELEDCDDDEHYLTVLAKVKVTKFNDYNRDGKKDTNEPTLPNWEMNLTSEQQCEIYEVYRPQTLIVISDFIYDEDECYFGNSYDKSQLTGEDGSTTFTRVRPKTAHTLFETEKQDWTWSNTYCEYNEENDGEVVSDNNYELYTYPGETLECFVGNYRDSELTLEKSNNQTQTGSPGDIVTYTLTVTVPDDVDEVFDAEVVDLPPENVDVLEGTETASSNIPGSQVASKVTNSGGPQYASPGHWTLGDLVPGEVVTLTYQAQISRTISSGVYPDIAYATAYDDPGNNFALLANADAPEPFVATDISVAAPKPPALANTGAALQLMQFIIPILAIITAAALLPRQKKGGRA